MDRFCVSQRVKRQQGAGLVRVHSGSSPDPLIDFPANQFEPHEQIPHVVGGPIRVIA